MLAASSSPELAAISRAIDSCASGEPERNELPKCEWPAEPLRWLDEPAMGRDELPVFLLSFDQYSESLSRAAPYIGRSLPHCRIASVMCLCPRNNLN